jgi:MFS family permease
LLPSPGTHDVVDVHENRIMEPMKRARPHAPGIVLAAASGAQAAVAFVTVGLPAIGPELSQVFQLSLAGLGAVLTAGLFGAGLALIAAGMAVDRFGTRGPLLAGTALGVVGLGVAASASSTAVLLAALVAFGVGSAVVPIAGAGALFSAYPPARRAWALGVRQMSVPLGGTIAALAMPGLEDYGGVRLTLGVAAVFVAITGVVFAYAAGPQRAPLGRVHQPLRSIWRTPGMQRLLVVAALYIVVLQAVLAFSVPSALAAGLTALAASATFFAINVSAMVSRIVWGRVADRGGGSRRVRTLAEVGIVAALGALLFTLALHLGTSVVIPAAVLFGFGALGWNALVYVTAGERAVPELAARSVAVAATVVFLISAISTPLLGALAAHAGWDVFWVVTAVLAAAGSLVASRLPASVVR